MADPRAMKRNLLQDLMQRARSSTNAGGVKFLSSNNAAIKGTRSTTLKSPKSKPARSSGRKLHLPSVFRLHKESPTAAVTRTPEAKTDSLKENARRHRGGKNKRPKSFCEEEKLSLEVLKTQKQGAEVSDKRDRTLAEKVLQTIKEKHTPHREKSKLPQAESSVTPQHVLYTTYQENNLKSLLQNEESVTVIPWKQNKTIPASPGRSLTTKVTYCHSCGHVDEKTEIKEVKAEERVIKSDNVEAEPTASANKGSKKVGVSFIEKERKSKSPEAIRKKNKLIRSNSDPTCSPRREQGPRILHHQRQEVKKAKISYRVDFQQQSSTQIIRRLTDSDLLDVCNEQTAADLEQSKLETHQRAVFLEYDTSFSDEFGRKVTMSKHKTNNSIEDACPLLKTKIPEEFIQEDGSVTLRKGNTEGQKRTDADRDSGVEIDSAGKMYQRLNSNDSEIDADQEQTATPDSLLESTAENENQEFDFDTLKKSDSDTTTTDNCDETEVDSSTLTRRRPTFSLQEQAEWDMYALLRRFELVEWELAPATNLKRQTLDLDNCDLDTVPAAVTEIEYYAFRDVEAVSLNHNRKIMNADVLGKLADLRVINMWGCNLQTIPQTWARLTKLQMLGLGNNKNLTSFGPLKHLTNLIWLDLGGCGLKQIPDEVTNMMKLKVLALGGNPGLQIGDEICSLWDLKKLGLNDCELEEIPKPVFSLIKLTHLHLDNNYIRHIDQEIVQLTELEELTVTGNDDIIFPKILSQCDAISCIIVDQNRDLSRVSGTLKNRMRQMPTAMSPVHLPPPKARHATIS